MSLSFVYVNVFLVCYTCLAKESTRRQKNETKQKSDKRTNKILLDFMSEINLGEDTGFSLVSSACLNTIALNVHMKLTYC